LRKLFDTLRCGKQFDTLSRSNFACMAPITGFQNSRVRATTRGKLDSDVCIIDGKDIFVRGCLEIPIMAKTIAFMWGVWVSVSKESFARILELWDAPIVEKEPPKFGWLCNNISSYPPT